MTRGTDSRFGALTSTATSDTISTQDILDAFTAYKNLAAMYGQGVRSARPAAGKGGRFYWATDEQTAYYDDGATWTTTAPRHFVINAAGTGSVQPNNNTVAGSLSKTVPTCTALVRISAVLVGGAGGEYVAGLGLRVDGTNYDAPAPSHYLGTGGGTINYGAAIQVPLTAGPHTFAAHFTLGSAPGAIDWRSVSIDVVLGAAG